MNVVATLVFLRSVNARWVEDEGARFAQMPMRADESGARYAPSRCMTTADAVIPRGGMSQPPSCDVSSREGHGSGPDAHVHRPVGADGRDGQCSRTVVVDDGTEVEARESAESLPNSRACLRKHAV